MMYSIRMRASAEGFHVSGGERLICGRSLPQVLSQLLWKGITSPVIRPEEIHITIEPVDEQVITYLKALPVSTVRSESIKEARAVAKDLLKQNGIKEDVIGLAFRLLDSGPGPGGKNMRGAIIMDYGSGRRLEPDRERGVRISRIDYAGEARESLIKALKHNGIYHERVVDALAVASKVTSRKETVAELCLSDDPGYTTGYVASRKSGYVRILNLKEKGHPKGGRVFFVRLKDLCAGSYRKLLEEYIHYLEKAPILIDKIDTVHG